MHRAGFHSPFHDGAIPRKAVPRNAINGLALSAAAFALAGCAGNLSALDPAGPEAGSIARLWWIMLAGGTALFLLVVGLFLLTMFVPGFGRRVSPGMWIVLGGLVLPVPVLAALVHAALFQGETLLGGGDDRTPLRVEAVARQWEWEFRYPDQPDLEPSFGVLHIPVGRPVEVVAVSEDVIHSFWVPRLGGKIDAIPGHVTRLRITADAPGVYGGVCAEYCGTGHTGMQFRVEAHPERAFAALAAGEGGE